MRWLSFLGLAACAPTLTPTLTPTPTPAPAPAPTPAPAPAPCLPSSLSFWLGDWDLVIRSKSPDGTWTEDHGENHVTAPLGRCVVQEDFRADGSPPWTGRSVSMFVPAEGAWRQTWVDDQGAYLAFRGGPEADRFVLYGEPATRDGKTRQMRMVFQDVTRDALRWTWERGQPGGTAWEPVMEIRYARQRRAPAPGTRCDDDPSYHDLDFWLGAWTVTEHGQPAGHNRIEKILGGCAIVEHWTEPDGSEGQGLFYHPPGSARWRQVWITPQATSTGGSKEKNLVARLPGGGLRFQGELPLPDGGTVFDRTTLTPLEGGRVRQVIELSRDRGVTWKTGFDAVYAR